MRLRVVITLLAVAVAIALGGRTGLAQQSDQPLIESTTSTQFVAAQVAPAQDEQAAPAQDDEAEPGARRGGRRGARRGGRQGTGRGGRRGGRQGAGRGAGRGGRRGGRGGIAPVEAQAPEEGTDVYPVPPEDFKTVRENIPHGELEIVEYDSKSLGTRRLMRVYTPAGYSADREYPVLYLHHGLGNTSTEWLRAGARIIADNLLADEKMEPMIIVFPQGSAGSTAADESQGTRDMAGFGTTYENDLLNDIIPFVESRYSVSKDRAHRAIAGMSMGGGQTLNFGLTNLDVFGSVAAVAPAPNLEPIATLIPDPEPVKELELLWLGVGNRDPLMRNSQGVHTFLLENEIPHIWRLDGNGHDPVVMAHNFYHFAQLLFKE